MAKVHLIGNAHLDPVWLWRWQEGYSEVFESVNTINVRPRKKRVGRYTGYTNKVKKAIVTLKEGSSIELN